MRPCATPVNQAFMQRARSAAFPQGRVPAARRTWPVMCGSGHGVTLRTRGSAPGVCCAGGSFNNVSRLLRAAYRDDRDPGHPGVLVEFRVVWSAA